MYFAIFLFLPEHIGSKESSLDAVWPWSCTSISRNYLLPHGLLWQVLRKCIGSPRGARVTFWSCVPSILTANVERLGTAWATSFLGFLAMSMTPLPWVFYRFGPKLGALSKYDLQTAQAKQEVKGKDPFQIAFDFPYQEYEGFCP